MSLKSVDPLKYRVRFLILMLLAIKPSHGYELLKRLDNVTKGLIKGGSGTVYPILRDLKEEGLIAERVVSEGARRKKVYEITEKGAKEIVLAIDTFHSIVNNLIKLAEDARRKLIERYEIRGYNLCPDESFVEMFRKLSELMNAQLERMERALENCRKSSAKGQGS